MRAHLVPYFKTLDRVTPGRIGDYQRDRLRLVTRATVRKERNTLATFLVWCREQEIADVQMPTLAKGIGTRATTRKAKAIDITPGQALAFLWALPVLSRGKIRQSHRFPVRARYVVAWETGLRPSTLDKLSIPEHWAPGSSELVIEDAIDKARFGRTVPLTELARLALESAAPANGLVFGRRCYRMYVSEAASAAQLPAGFSPYDMRHGRALQLTEASGNLPGVAFLLGHRKLTTTSLYLRGTRRAADAALAAAVLSGAAAGASAHHAPRPQACKVSEGPDTAAVVRGPGLEPGRCYPLAPQGSDDWQKPLEVRSGWVEKGRGKPRLVDPIGGMPPEIPGLAKGAVLLGLVDIVERYAAGLEAAVR